MHKGAEELMFDMCSNAYGETQTVDCLCHDAKSGLADCWQGRHL